jgi:hypothetical protein
LALTRAKQLFFFFFFFRKELLNFTFPTFFQLPIPDS